MNSYTLSLIYTAFCLSIAMESYGANKGTGQKETIARIERLGGKIRVAQDAPGNPIIHLDLSNTKATDDVLKDVNQFTELRVLRLGKTKITSNGLRHLRLPNLEILFLQDTSITDKGLLAIRKMPRLKFLFLNGTNISDNVFNDLLRLKRLRVLELSHTAITDSAVHKLTKMRNLTFLAINGTKLTKTAKAKLREAMPNTIIVE